MNAQAATQIIVEAIESLSEPSSRSAKGGRDSWEVSPS